MLRYFYLISLFICINTTLLEARSNRNIHSHKRARAGRVKKSIVNNRQGSDQRYEYDNRSPVQQFDVASFIQGSDEAVDDDQPYGFEIKKGRSSKNFDYDIGLSNKNKKEKSQDYFNIGSDNMPEFKYDSLLFKDTLNPKYLDTSGASLDDSNTAHLGRNKIRNIYKDYFLDPIQNHNPAKKCALKTMKFPFFSHNKSTLKPKKNRKRKLFGFNSPKKTNKPVGMILKKVEEEPNITIKTKRLSDDDNSCSPCRKQQRKLQERKQKKSSVIHNSRQFFQNIQNTDNMERNAKQFTDNAETTVGKVREKREEIDRERQLKELEEVQRKIDAVQIHMPTFEKKPADPFD